MTMEPAAVPTAPAWRRLVAFLLDNVIEASALYSAGFVVATLLPDNIAPSPAGIGLVLGVFFDWLYFSAFESSRWRGSPGKRLLGMTVQDLDGRRISFVRASARYSAKLLSAVLLMAGFVMIALHRRNRGLHDVIAGTLVVRNAAPRASTSA